MGEKDKSQRALLIFLTIWTVINLIQAAFVELHADEAYYWVYSRFLDWGYFDHPPMVAVFIKLGDAINASTLGLRLFTVLSSTLSIYLLWKMLRSYAENIRLFIVLYSAIVLFHVYGFITTPDAPLSFFIVLFFYIYQRYEKEDKLKWAFLLSIAIACLLYSKYHAILVLFFTILSNFKLLQRRSFWLVVAASIIVYVPHIWWQVQNGLPSFYYHVIDRSADLYKASFTGDYIVAQLALAGPLIGWYLYKSVVLFKAGDSFLRAVKFNCVGIFIFFLLSTFKGRVEAHWTLPAMLGLFMLAYVALAKKGMPKWLERLALVNIGLVILVRLILIFPVDALMKIKVVAYYFGTEKWANEIHKRAGASPVIFTDSFQVPSRYNYYTRSTQGFGYDSRYYRKNQYDIWELEDSLRNKRAYYAIQSSFGENVVQDTIQTTKGVYYGRWLDSVRLYQKAKVNPVEKIPLLKPGSEFTVTLQIYNPYDEAISLGNAGQKWKCYLEYGFKKDGGISDFKTIVANTEVVRIPAKGSIQLSGTFIAPENEGKYKMILSIRTEPFAGSRNSDMIPVEVSK
jgi:hypothetical protein